MGSVFLNTPREYVPVGLRRAVPGAPGFRKTLPIPALFSIGDIAFYWDKVYHVTLRPFSSSRKISPLFLLVLNTVWLLLIVITRHH